MATIFGLDPSSSVILAVAVIGIVPVVLYYKKTYRWFVYAYACMVVAAFATNFESLFLPNVLNLTEHVVGNLGTGIALALAAYLYRKEHILTDAEPDIVEEV